MEEGQYLSFQGLDVFFRVHEPKGLVRHRILLIPGPLSDGSVFDALLPGLLSLNCLVVTVDLPGFGMSAAGAGVPMGAKMRAKILWGILDSVDMRISFGARSWHVLAHGSAVFASMEMAAENPESVLSQILVCPVFAPRDEKHFRRALKDKEVLAWYDDTIRQPRQFRNFMNLLYGTVLPAEKLKSLNRPLLNSALRDELPRLLREGYSIDPEAFGAFGPTMILRGEHDSLSGHSFTRDVAEALKGAEMHRIPNSGHFPTETHADEVMDYIRGWLRYIDE